MFIIDRIKGILKRDHTFISKHSIKWYGTEYGGFFLDQALLNSSSELLSFGVGEDISFDLAVAEENIQNIHLFDPTPKAIEYIKRTGLPDNFHFYPVGISDQNEDANFFLPKNEHHVSGSLLVHKQLDTENYIKVPLKKLSTIVNDLNLQHVNILKMDIEGSEYKVLKNIMQDKILPIQICVEFHNNFYKNGEGIFKETLDLLEENGYDVKAISKSGREFLFIR